MTAWHTAACGAVTFALAGMWAGPAPAVDITNKGTEPAKVTVVTESGRKSVTVPAGETIKDVCDSCTVEGPSGNSREAAGGQTVTLSGPLLLVSGQP